MKKTISLFLSILLVFTLALPAFAFGDFFRQYDDEPYGMQCEDDISFAVRYDGKEILYARYLGEDGVCRVPKTLGGIAVTPESLSGVNLFNSNYISEFVVDADNAYFSVRDGMLLSKDGKTLIFCPESKCNCICTLPEGVETLGPWSFCIYNSCCIVLPDSVELIDPDFCESENVVLAGAAGSYAESFAKENNVKFVVLGEGHAHAYFRQTVDNGGDCEKSTTVNLICPCGDCLQSGEMEPIGHCWNLSRSYSEDGEGIVWDAYCMNCNKYYREIYGTDPTEEFMREQFGDEYDQWSDDDFYGEESGFYTYSCNCICHELEYEESWAIEVDESHAILWGLVENMHFYIHNFKLQCYNIQLFFWRMLGINRYCNCGVRHY